PCASLGVQVIRPLVEIVAPSGVAINKRVSGVAGRCASVAVFVIRRVVSSAIVRFICAASTGARFTSVTVTVKLLVALSDGVPLSTTRVVIVYVPGPCASVGIQLITPLVEIAAPA